MPEQAKRKTEREDPLLNNRFVACDGVEPAVGALLTLIVCNSERDPKYPMFPTSDEACDLLYKYIDRSEELHHLLDGDPNEVQEEYFEVGQSVYTIAATVQQRGLCC